MSTQRVAAIALCFLLFAQDGEANSRRRDEGARMQQSRLSTSWQHTCAVRDDGSVRCWGANQQGQIGNGAVSAAQSVPVSPTQLSAVSTIAAGRDHTCAIVTAGGQGSHRCVHVDSRPSADDGEELAMLPAAVRIVAVHSCVIDDGDVVLKLELDDGGIAATHWPLAQLHTFVARVREARHAPVGATVQ